ncbi:unnamed protein product [Dovyalis caffra]|uniref:Uncharacterized protein n=1 Tax=Dovyalis caffra TaxID=77055 RepID=A0AAV1R8D1_9ROSI|nr:unnamed protein product [Dovyalis caffra]
MGYTISCVKSLQVFRPGGFQGGGIEGPPYLHPQLMHRAQAKTNDDYVVKTFKKLPMLYQEKIIEELSDQLHQQVLVKKLSDESEEAFRLRCFVELFTKLPSDSRQSFNNEFQFPLKLPFHSYNRFEGNSHHDTRGPSVSRTILSGLSEGLAQQIAQGPFEGIVGEESSLTLDFFKVKALYLRGAHGVEDGSASTTTSTK